MDSRNSHAAVIIKPNYDPAPARVNTRVIRAGNRIAVTATGHDGKRLKRGCGKMLAYIGGHEIGLVIQRDRASAFWGLTRRSSAIRLRRARASVIARNNNPVTQQTRSLIDPAYR